VPPARFLARSFSQCGPGFQAAAVEGVARAEPGMSPGARKLPASDPCSYMASPGGVQAGRVFRPPGQRAWTCRTLVRSRQSKHSPLQQEVHRLPVVAGWPPSGQLQLPAAQPVRPLPAKLAGGWCQLPSSLHAGHPGVVRWGTQEFVTHYYMLADVDRRPRRRNRGSSPALFHQVLLS